ncbi:MAG: glycosyltransferase family 4 protein [Chloroflexi bacterium]|nr:glycosyltransferase family 4 protein [Chloroflexota bacterium]
MNILFLVLNVVGKGTYWRALHLARELVKREHTVTLVVTAKENRFHLTERQIAGVTQVETPDLFSGSLRSGWDLWNALRRVAWLRGRNFDVAHSFETRPTVLLPALYEKRLRGCPVVFDWADWFGRGGSVEERSNPLLRGLLRPVESFFEEQFRDEAARTTVICSLLEQKAQALGVASETILHLPNGCNTEQFFPVERDAARQRTGLTLSGLVIGYCGTIFPRDAQLMATAFDQLRAWHPDARLLVIGYCPFDIGALVANPEAIIQTGYVAADRINDYFNACDICWLPFCDTNANRGRWPMKLNDYMAVGRPTVATAVGDVADLIRQEPIGLLASVDPLSIAQQTMRLVNAPDLRRDMGARARELAISRFSWASLAGQLETLYTEIV